MAGPNNTGRSSKKLFIITKDTPKEQMIALAPPCQCSKCENGCHYGSGVLDDSDLQPMAGYLHISVEKLKEKHLERVEKFNTAKYRPKIKREHNKPYGACTFFSRWKGCTIHPVKPLECKTSTGCGAHGETASVWFDISQFVNKDDPESIRQFAAYLQSGGKTIPGASLQDLVPDGRKLKDILSYKILKQDDAEKYHDAEKN